MADFDSSRAVFKSSATKLSKIMNLDVTKDDAWSERDLPGMLRHQLSAPLEFDLSRSPPSKSSESISDGLSAAGAGRIKTFKDLLEHPKPPLAVLKATKDFFKRQAGASLKRRPEQEVAYLMYLLLIVVARVRLETPITKLNDAELLKGIRWALDLKWVDERTRAMLAEANEALHPGENK